MCQLIQVKYRIASIHNKKKDDTIDFLVDFTHVQGNNLGKLICELKEYPFSFFFFFHK